MPDSDVDPLLRALADGTEEAFATLYDRYAARLFAVACGSLRNAADAEDVVQEVFISLVRSRSRLARVEDLTAYLFASLRREVSRAARRGRRASNAAATESVVDRATVPAPRSTSDGEALERALRRLPEAQREIVALKIDGGLTFRNIGSVLGISPHTAASRYRLALESLRRILASTENRQ